MRPVLFRVLVLSTIVSLVSILSALDSESAQADIIKLKTGVIYEGKITNRRGSSIEFQLRDGTTRTFLEHQIGSAEEKPCSWDVFEERKAALDKNDAEAWLELAGFCGENGLWIEWRQCLETALGIDPESKDARRFLDFEKTDSGWEKKDLADGSWSAEDYLRNGYVWNRKKSNNPK